MGVAAVRSVHDKKVNVALKKTCVTLSVVWSVTTAPVSQMDPESVSVSAGNIVGISGFQIPRKIDNTQGVKCDRVKHVTTWNL